MPFSSSSSSRSSFRPASGGSWAGYHPPGYAARETLKTAKRAVLPHVVPPEFDSATQAARERNKKWSLHSSVCLGLEEETGAIVSVGTRQHRHPRGTQTSGAGVATDNETARADHKADAAAASARARRRGEGAGERGTDDGDVASLEWRRGPARGCAERPMARDGEGWTRGEPQRSAGTHCRRREPARVPRRRAPQGHSAERSLWLRNYGYTGFDTDFTVCARTRRARASG